MRLLTWLTILFYVGIVVLPFAIIEVPQEVARWYLASARNAIQLEEGDPESLLKKAVQWSDSDSIKIGAADVRLSAAILSNPTRFPETFRRAIEQYPLLSIRARVFSQLLLEAGHRRESVDTLKLYPIQPNPKSGEYISFLNQLAYFRALASYELDEALVGIEQALASLPTNAKESRAAFLDTRAWVLHKLDRNGEALVDINKSIKLTESWLTNLTDSVGASSGSTMTDDQDDSPDDAGKADDETSEARAAADSRVALYYHRMKINEALGNEDEAAQDRQWLKQRGHPTDQEIF